MTKQLNIAIAVLGLLLVTVSASADEVQDGTDAYLRGDYAEALKLSWLDTNWILEQIF